MKLDNFSVVSLDCKDSSLLEKIEWHPNNKKFNLKLFFKPSSISYTYKIPEDLFKKFISAESLGKFFSQHIKNDYTGEKE